MALGTGIAIGAIGAGIHAENSGANMHVLDFDAIEHTSVNELYENAVEYVGRFKCDLDHDQAPNVIECDIDDALKLVGITEMHPYVDARMRNNLNYFAYLDYYHDNGRGKTTYYSQLNRIDGDPGEWALRFEDLDGFPKDGEIPNKVLSGDGNDFINLHLYFQRDYAEDEFVQLEGTLQVEFPEVFQSVNSVLYGVYFDEELNLLVEDFMVSYIDIDGEGQMSEFRRYTNTYDSSSDFEPSESTGIFESLKDILVK